jgi:peptidoglycan L-alanyl-D-glutamate endopeptidase CwlK
MRLSFPLIHKIRLYPVFGKQLGLSWGGDWKHMTDQPHYELRPQWATSLSEDEMLAELRARKDSGKSVLA